MLMLPMIFDRRIIEPYEAFDQIEKIHLMKHQHIQKCLLLQEFEIEFQANH